MCAVKNKIEKYIDKLWNKEWQSSTKILHTKQIIPRNHKSKKLTKFILTKSKYEIKNIVEWITGHGSLNKNQFYLGHSNTKLCRICMADDETPNHIMMSCPGTEQIRLRETLLNKSKTIRFDNNNYIWTDDYLTLTKIEYIVKCIKETKTHLSWEL